MTPWTRRVPARVDSDCYQIIATAGNAVSKEIPEICRSPIAAMRETLARQSRGSKTSHPIMWKAVRKLIQRPFPEIRPDRPDQFSEK
jgi:hypothetical protein